MSMKSFNFYIYENQISINCNYLELIVIKTYSHRIYFELI